MDAPALAKTEERGMQNKRKTDATAKARRLAPLSLCVARMALKYLHALMAEMERVRQAQDRECVHRMRVASRRLRSVLPLLATSLSCRTCARWRKHLRRITRVLGSVRDIDVQSACVQQFLHDRASTEDQAGIERLSLRLEQRRQALQGPVVKALERFASRQLAEEMEETLTQVASESEAYEIDVPGRRVYRQTRKGILKRLDAFEAYAPYVRRPECVKELHAMRIAAKRLRYIMQALAPLYPDELAEPIQASRLCQTRLGDIHDCDVWIDTLPRFLEAEQERTLVYFGSATPFEPLRAGILALHLNRQQQREQDYQEFVMFWDQLQAQGVWERLRQTLAAPHAAAEVSAETATAALAGDGASVPTPQDVAQPAHDASASCIGCQ
jgi:CHAD domain-containing protein